MTSPDRPPIPDRPPETLLRWERLRDLAFRVGPSTPQPKKWTRHLWIPLSALALLMIAGGGFRVFNAFLHARPEVTVPDLKGKKLEEALDLLAPFHLALFKESVEYDENVPAGFVLRQSPPAGLKVREGKTVRVALSSGGQMMFVPELSNASMTEAQNRLRTAGLVPGGVMEVYSARYEAGLVMKQNPAPGSLLRRGQMVDMTVSRGEPPAGLLLMPDWSGRPVEEARRWASAQGFWLMETEESRPGFQPGHVVAQQPVFDTVLSSGATLSLTVNVSSAKVLAPSRSIRYTIPMGAGRVAVKVLLRDGQGERVLFEGEKEAGSKLECPLTSPGPAQVKIFLNGVLVEVRDPA